jgi:hypothetical protein
MLAKHKKTGKVYALKVLSKKTIKQRDEVKHIMAGPHGPRACASVACGAGG